MLLLRLFASKDRGVYAFCSLLGYLIFLGMRPAAWAASVAILVTYHLFLVYCIISAEEGRPRTYNLLVTISGHLGLVLVCVGVRYEIFDFIRDSVSSQPDLLRSTAARAGGRLLALLTVVLVYGMVSLELKLLFDGKRGLMHDAPKDMEPIFVEMSAKLRNQNEPLIAATGADHHEWVQYCQRRNAKYYNPSLSPKDDFEQWLRARGKTQFLIAQSEAALAAD
jgi:hypothetical protein